MKKQLNIFRILICMFCAAAPLLFASCFLVQQKVARHAMKERLEEDRLQSIRLRAGEFVWTDDNDEIMVNGELFDVKSFILSNGYYHFKGLFDNTETLLVKQLDNDWKKDPSAHRRLVLLIDLFQSFFCTPENNFSPVFNGGQLHAKDPSEKLPAPFRMILTPPPQV